MKKIVIVGATSGLGLRVAEVLASAGWRVGAAGRNEKALEELRSRYPEQIEWQRIDVMKKESPQQLRKLIDKLGGMDIYLNVAGIGFENTTLNSEHEVDTLRTNVVGFTRMVITAFKYFRDECNGVGQIAAITSVAGTKGIGELASYSASKKFQQTYLQALEQLSNMNGLKIYFTDIRPGWVRTPLLREGRVYPMVMEPEPVVREVIRAIIKRRRVKVIDGRWELLYTAWRLLPSWLWVRMKVNVSNPKK